MEQLRIKRKDLYEVQVNDNGDTIVFDLSDVDLPFKMQRAFDKAKAVQKNLKGQIIAIEKMDDSRAKGALYTKKQEAKNKARKKAFDDMRKAMDEFLGEGGCQKIFGDTNYLSMYDDLFEELTKKGEDGLSHYDKMQLNVEGVQKRIEEKYGNIDEDILEL